MAVARPHVPRAIWLAVAPRPLPKGVLVVALVGPILDLLTQVQHLAALGPVALVACALAAALLGAWLVRDPRPAVMAAALAMGASTILRLSASPDAALLALLGVLALGIGGLFPAGSGEVEAALDDEGAT